MRKSFLFLVTVFFCVYQPTLSQNLAGRELRKAIAVCRNDTVLRKIDFAIYEMIDYQRKMKAIGRDVTVDNRERKTVFQINEQGKILCYLWLRKEMPTGSLGITLRTIDGVDVVAFRENYQYVQAYISIYAFEDVAKIEDIYQISPVIEGFTNEGCYTSEGDQRLNADVARQKFGIKGANVTVGVISDGVNPNGSVVSSNDSLDKAKNELPSVVSLLSELDEDGAQLMVMNNSMEKNTAEGTAMLEIVHDLAPEADLLFFSAWPTPEAFLDTAIWALNRAGCDIMVDDVSNFTQPYFEDSAGISKPVYEKVNDFSNRGGLYVSSVGNQSCNYYESQFNDPDSDNYHNFENNDETLNFELGVNQTIVFYIQWSNKWGDATTVLDAEIWRKKVLFDDFVKIGSTIENGNPYVSIVYENTDDETENCYLKLKRILGEKVPYIKVYYQYYVKESNGYNKVFKTVDEYYNGKGSSFGHPVFKNTMAVGAIPVNNNTEEDQRIEGFSSYGPCSIFSDFEHNIYDLRKKPDVLGSDGVTVSGAFGFGNDDSKFSGTSAAAPHVAAVAALIKSSYLNLSNDQIRTILCNTAEKTGTNHYKYDLSGMSCETGFGRIDAYNALRIGRKEYLSYGYYIYFVDCYTSESVKEPGHNPGKPLEDVQSNWIVVGFEKQKYQNGAIVYQKETDEAFWLGEGIWQKWVDAGAVRSDIGLPMCSEFFDADNNDYPTVNFTNGTIYWNGSEALVDYINEGVEAGNIAYLEYFFDKDPGYGNGIRSYIHPSDTVNAFRYISLTNLSSGFHRLFFRTKNEEGKWSMTLSRPIYITDTDEKNVVNQIDYFLDEQSTLRNQLNFQPSDEVALCEKINVESVTPGMHRIYFRTRNNSGIQSVIQSSPILVTSDSQPCSISAVTYNFDDFKSTATIDVEPAVSVFVAYSLAISQLSSGWHRLYLSAQSESGRKGIIYNRPFYIDSSSMKINYLEYFFDEDPGLLKGEPISVNAGFDITTIMTIPLDSLSCGTHSISFRAKNDHENWSSLNVSDFTILIYTTTLLFKEGWNIFSSNVIPDNRDLKVQLQPLINAGTLRKTLDESGNSIEYAGLSNGWVNTIGNLNQAKGYQVNVSDEIIASIEGSLVELPQVLNLKPGLNIVSYPSAFAQNARVLVQPLIDEGKLIKVQDETGKTIENFGDWGGWKNNLGNFISGKGYKIYVSDSGTMTVNALSEDSLTSVATILPSLHFPLACKGNGYNHMNIHLLDQDAMTFREGDEIGVFDGKCCVGSVTIGQNQPEDRCISIQASCDDGLDEKKNGFIVGHPMVLYLYRDSITYNLNMVYQKGSDFFVEDGSLFANVTIGQVVDNLVMPETNEVFCYPNPFSEILNIDIKQFNPKIVDIRIIDQFGQLVKEIYHGAYVNGMVLEWNGTDGSEHYVSPGVYFCKINTHIRKIIWMGKMRI